MKMNIKPNFKALFRIFSYNYHQIAFVFLSFVLMVLSSYFFMSTILQKRLILDAENVMYTAEANVRAAFSEAEVTITTTFYEVRDMIESGATNKDITDYLIRITNYLRQRENGLSTFYGIYGYIREELIDSIGINPEGEFIVQKRPWYQEAVRSRMDVAFTAPYVDEVSHSLIITATKNIVSDAGEIYGILAIDINIDWLNDYVKSLRLTDNGYGALINQNMTVVVHPDEKKIGMQIQELSSVYSKIAQRLRKGEEIVAERIMGLYNAPVIIFFKKIFNGWYVGLITPRNEYYSDLTNTSIILSILGVLLGLSLSFILLQVDAAKMKSDEENISKSSFLARMSHEIRTPMNAIIGMSELALRNNPKPEVRPFLVSIKQASHNLLGIINDILDFSKIEAGKLEIIPAEYKFSSLLNDVITIIKMRMQGRPVEFLTQIDQYLPGVLYGDENRIREVLLNLLTNAVKYTAEGSITFSVYSYPGISNQYIQVVFEVKDTGTGIRPEDVQKLFGEYMQTDSAKHFGMEGTGLGLAITRSLCKLMGGDITVRSVFGEGSTFTAIIPQRVMDASPFKIVEADNENSNFAQPRFTAPKACVLIVDDIDTNLDVASGLLAPYKMRLEFATNGTQTIRLAKDNLGRYDLILMDHMMPGVDGIEAMERVRKLGDEYYKKLPIVIMTANAVSGMKEMFLAKGFDDYISKPIDIEKLNELIARWIPKEKQVPLSTEEEQQIIENTQQQNQGENKITIPEVDVQKGISMTGGTEALYMKVLQSFCKDARDRMPALTEIETQTDIESFTIQVHALKSASATIGAGAVSEMAKDLEAAGKESDREKIEKLVPAFKEKLTALTENINTVLADYRLQSAAGNAAGVSADGDIKSVLSELKKALETKNIKEIDSLIDSLENMKKSEEMSAIVEDISGQVLMSEYKKAIELVENLLNQ